MSKSWKKESGLESGEFGCLTCGPKPLTLGMDALLATGFGSVAIMRGDECMWEGDYEQGKNAQFAEDMALLQPDHDWRIIFNGAMRESHYQRHEIGKWVLIKIGQGFA